jgi:ectoine hydroxylase-related dioxygenase (phytanoyl-CoA dioxygenase family)
VNDHRVDEVTEALMADGYVIIEGALDPDNVRQKRQQLDDLLATTAFGDNSFLGYRTKRVFALLAKLRCFDDAVLHPLLLSVLDQVLVHYQLSVSTAIEIGPGESAQTLHADDGVYPLPTAAGPLTVNSMWAMDDFTEANGATRLVRHSHHQEVKQAHGPQPEYVAEMPAGSMLIYLGSLWHGGGANRTARPRLGVVIEYAVSWLRPQENLGLTYPPDLVRNLPGRLPELLGYNLYPPFLGYVDGRHPAELLGG